MSDLDEFFQDEPLPPEHPMARMWGPLLEVVGITAQCEVRREREGLTFSPPKLYVHFISADPTQSKTEFDEWDMDLNAFLIKRQVKAINPENERLRFMLMLKDLLKKSEIHLGDGYFNGVLIEVLKATGFATKPEVEQMLAKVGRYSPNKGRNYQDNFNSIKDPIKRCGPWLKRDLSYPQETAETILTGAIADYLDDRFSISNRKLLGLE